MPLPHSGYTSTLDGIEEGRNSCTAAKAADADLWRKVWDVLEPLKGRGPVSFHKVKAHTGWFQLLERSISPKHQFGNWLADIAAKEGARQSENLAPTASFEKEARKAIDWVKWAACLAASWVYDVDPSPPSEDRFCAA